MESSSDLLLEIHSLEIPARMQITIEEIFIPVFSKILNEYRIKFEEISILSSPSRVAVYIKNIKNVVDAISVETKGPRTNIDGSILEKFCTSNNFDKGKLIIKTIKNQDFYFYIEEVPKKQSSEILKLAIPKALSEIVWPKSMFWGNSKINWVRPIKNIMCIYGEKTLEFDYGGFVSNDCTFGHKFMSNNEEKIFVKNINEYKEKLKNNFCNVDRAERLEIIRSQIKEICIKNNLSQEIDEDLLREVVGLVDFPNTLMGTIKNEFMKIPHEIAIVAMKNHQRYFSCKNLDGSISNKFIFVSNIKTNNDNLIIEGNEKVLSSRLRDALYFYNQDTKDSFEAKFDNLKNLIFHQKLGSIKDKATRIMEVVNESQLSSGIVESQNDKEKLITAAKLCKIDLLSEAVGEFPELQGVMGKYYALSEGFDRDIALAIEEHYMPRGASDNVPKNNLSIKLSLLDKIDSMVGLFFAGERPTGSKDPYALRRLAISIIRIILENKIDGFELQNIVSGFIDKFLDNTKIEERKLLLSDLIFFIDERLKHMMKNEYKFDIKLINASIDLIKDDKVFSNYLKLEMLNNFINTKEGEIFVEAVKRITNILPDNFVEAEINEEIFSEKEKKLFDKFKEIKSINQQNDLVYLENISKISSEINDLFDITLVNNKDDEIGTKNRLSLLKKILDFVSIFYKFNKL